MAGKAPLFVERNLFLLSGDAVRIVAGCTTQSALTGLITPAGTHLLNLADDAGVVTFPRSFRGHKDCPDILQAIAGSEVMIGSPISQAALFSRQVALIADSLPLGNLEV